MIKPFRQAPQFLKDKAESDSIDELSTEQIINFFLNDKLLNSSLVPNNYVIDPRNGEVLIFNPARAYRPHNYPDGATALGDRVLECPICQGNTTGILDWVDLKEGFSFINKNMYPAITTPPLDQVEGIDPKAVIGLHFVQWTSSIHALDWHNLPIDDCILVMKRLAALEKVLLFIAQDLSNRISYRDGNLKSEWSVSIIKNSGALVGGSIEHGHQQIILSNLPPRRIKENLGFKEKTNQTYSEFLLTNLEKGLIIKDYGTSALIVSPFMRRPLEMVLVLEDTQKSFLSELGDTELSDVARGWKDASRIFRQIMPELKRRIAYNFVTHNGPGAGIYFEFLPYTQEQGGFEQLGLSVCQGDPFSSAERIRICVDNLHES